MRTPSFIGFAVIIILLSGACTQESQEGDGPTIRSGQSERQTFNDVVADIDSKIGDYKLLSGSTESGDMQSDYQAYFDGDDLVFIHEHMNMGENCYSVNRYYFHEDKLLYYDQDMLSKGSSDDGSPVTRAIVSWMVFDPDGTVIQAEKRVDGKSRAPEDGESNEVTKHVQEIIQLLKN